MACRASILFLTKAIFIKKVVKGRSYGQFIRTFFLTFAPFFYLKIPIKTAGAPSGASSHATRRTL